MKLRKNLLDLARVIADEAEKNREFADKLALALGLEGSRQPKSAIRSNATVDRPKHRRPAATLDPIALVRESEAGLRDRLKTLSIEELKDVVADYGMDSGKLVMKWKDSGRIIDRIVEISQLRAQKGDAFRLEY